MYRVVGEADGVAVMPRSVAIVQALLRWRGSETMTAELNFRACMILAASRRFWRVVREMVSIEMEVAGTPFDWASTFAASDSEKLALVAFPPVKMRWETMPFRWRSTA